MTKKITIAIIALTIFISCKKSSSENQEINEQNIPLSFDTTTCILHSSKINFIKEVHPDYIIIAGKNLGTARATGNTSAIEVHENGYFVSEPNIKFPKGTFNKIFKITPYGAGDFKAEFFPYDPNNPQTSICESLQSGSISGLQNVTDKINEAKDENDNPIPVEFDGGKLKFSINKKFDFDGNPATNDTFKVVGSVKMNFDFDYDLRVKNWKLEKFKAELKTKFDGELKASSKIPFIDAKKTIKLYDFYLKPIVFLVGGVFPVVLNPVITVNATVSAKGELTLEGTILKYSGDVSRGFEYLPSNGFSMLGNSNLPPASSIVNPALTASFEGEAKVSPSLDFRIKLYDKPDIAVSAGLGLYGKIKTTAEISTTNPNLFDLRAQILVGMEGKVTGKLKLFNTTIGDGELSYTLGELSLFDSKTFYTNWNPINNTNSLIAYYPFNGNTNDVSGNNNNGNVSGGIVYSSDRFNVANKACSFNGSDAFITVPPSSTLNSITKNTDATFTCWFKTDSWNNIGGHISKNNNANDLHYRFLINESSTLLQIEQPYGYANYSALNVNQWYHFAAVKSGNIAKFYIDGNLVNTVTMTDDVWASDFNTNLEIGRDAHGPVEYTRGVFDEIRIYKKALTNAEIIAVKNN